MLSFKEFQKEAARTADKRFYLSLEQLKECYKWYIKGCKSGFYTRHVADEVYAKHGKKPSENSVSIYFYKADKNLREIENAKTKEN